MFDSNSRYAKLHHKVLVVHDADGTTRELRYVERRFISSDVEGPTLTEHKVAQDERLDQITAKYLGDPTLFWRVADANKAIHPEELTAQTDRRLLINLPRY